MNFQFLMLEKTVFVILIEVDLGVGFSVVLMWF